MDNTDVITLKISAGGVSAAQICSTLGIEAEALHSGQRAFSVTLLPNTDESVAQGELIDWCDLLIDKASEIRTLVDSGCSVYLDCALRSIDMWMGNDVIEVLAKMGIGLSIWLKPPEQTDNLSPSENQLVIPQPLPWYSKAEENAFYEALGSIEGIRFFKIVPGAPLVGIPNNMVLMLDAPILDSNALRNLIGLMFRYSLNMSSLASQCSPDNEVWFRDPQNYWYEKVFADG
jgi:hypothetical protein